MNNIDYFVFQPGTVDSNDFLHFLKETDDLTMPCLSSRVNIKEYAKKVVDNAVMFIAKKGDDWIGVEAVYFNEYPNFSYNTILRVLLVPQEFYFPPPYDPKSILHLFL